MRASAAAVFRVSLVGYTNAGKSTLFNALTKVARVRRRPAVRDAGHDDAQPLHRGRRAHGQLSDTVGFIRDLPHRLVDAFEATLQEAADADLLLHVVDAASPQRDEQIAEVERVLREIGADRVPQILVFNKLDLLEPTQRPRVARDAIEARAACARRASSSAPAMARDWPSCGRLIAEASRGEMP